MNHVSKFLNCGKAEADWVAAPAMWMRSESEKPPRSAGPGTEGEAAVEDGTANRTELASRLETITLRTHGVRY